MATCVFLSGIFQCAEAALADGLRRKALAVGAVTGVIIFAAPYPLAHDARTMAEAPSTHASPLLIVALLAEVGTLILVVRRRYAAAGFSSRRRRTR